MSTEGKLVSPSMHLHRACAQLSGFGIIVIPSAWMMV